MQIEKIENLVLDSLIQYCDVHGIKEDVDKNTPLIGSNSVLDSIGLVNFIVDVETSFLDEGYEVSLTSESAMSSRISPFRSVLSVSNFILTQLTNE